MNMCKGSLKLLTRIREIIYFKYVTVFSLMHQLIIQISLISNTQRTPRTCRFILYSNDENKRRQRYITAVEKHTLDGSFVQLNAV